MNKATIVKVDGSKQELDHRPTLEEAQGIVGGHIEFAKGVLDDKAVTLILDDEGLLKGKVKNTQATLMYWGKYPHTSNIIVGDVIVLEGWKTVGA